MNIHNYLPNQEPGESIYIFIRPYFLSFLPTLGLGIGLVLAGLLMVILTSINFPELAAPSFDRNIFVVVATIYFLTLIPFFTVAFLTYYYDIQIVTDHRIIDIDQVSLFKREVNELDLEEVQDASSTTAGILSSYFDFGHVIIETAGSTPKFFFHNVLHPGEIASIILDLASQAKREPGKSVHHFVPSGKIKGVINNKLYTSTEELAKTGALAPETEEEAGITPTESPTPSKPQATDKPAPASKSANDQDLDIAIDEPTPKK